MADRPSPTNVLVVLEALFHGIGVRSGDQSFNLGVNSENGPCITTMITMDNEDDAGQEIESECLMGVDFDLSDFLQECAQLKDSYVTELAHRTALRKLTQGK